MDTYFFSHDEILLLHLDQIKRYGGMPGLRDAKLLDAAIHYPMVMFNKQYLHSDLYRMAAAYMYAIIKNHPFLDGNKRTGLVSAILFLSLHDIFLDVTNEQLFDLAVSVATSQVSEKEIAIFFEQNSMLSF